MNDDDKLMKISNHVFHCDNIFLKTFKINGIQKHDRDIGTFLRWPHDNAFIWLVKQNACRIFPQITTK